MLFGTLFTAAALLAGNVAEARAPPPNDTRFQNLAIDTINEIRKFYKADNLTWDTTLAMAAMVKAEGCRLDHSGPYGENAYSVWFNPPDTTPDFTFLTRRAIQQWASDREINAYKAGDLRTSGHFTQNVWKATRRMGCAWKRDRCEQNPRQEWWFYCDFFPRGNVVGHYKTNVTVWKNIPRGLEEEQAFDEIDARSDFGEFVFAPALQEQWGSF